MAKQSQSQKETVQRVMHEFKHGELDRARGGKVRNPKQAIAIALHEAGASNQESPGKNTRNLAATKKKERAGKTGRAVREGGATRAALYKEAARRNIPGRSRMSKAALQKALEAM